MPTPDDLRALARSSPWRCTSAHFTRRRRWGGQDEVVEAWLDRPGRSRIRDERGEHSWVDGMQTGIPRDMVAAWSRMPERYADEVLVSRAEQLRWIHREEPLWRADGLVALRPDQGVAWHAATGELPQAFEVDDPMYDNYTWVAMLDPLELSAGVDLTEVRETVHHGRTAWAARAVPVEGYEPRCGCCPLLWNLATDRDEYGDERDLSRTVYPEAFEVVLDHATGFVVLIAPLWAPDASGHRDDIGFDVEIHASA